MAAGFKLYSRRGCHLCDEMLHGLLALQSGNRFDVEVIDIDADPELQREFTLRIPVLSVADDHKVICEQVLDQQAVMQYLASANT